jgi:AraC-like DNA-binding protein
MGYRANLVLISSGSKATVRTIRRFARRIERAKSLLAASKLSVTEIALDVGFSELSSFTSAFRKVTGETPTDYRCGVA